MTKTNSNHLDASRHLKDVICVTFKNWNALWGFLPVVAHLTCTHFCVSVCASVCAEELYIHLVHALCCEVRGKKWKRKFWLICTKEKSKKCLFQITTVGEVVPLVSLMRTTLSYLAQQVFSFPLFTSAQDVLSSGLDLTLGNMVFAYISVSCTPALT